MERNTFVEHCCTVDHNPISLLNQLTRLGLEQTRNRVPIKGINNATALTNYKVELEMRSLTTNYMSMLNCLVLPRITSNMPMSDTDISTWEFPPDIKLADKDFHKSAPIDILLGAEVFFEILMNGRFDCEGLPVLQNTKLGYILSGKTHQCYVRSTRINLILFSCRRIPFIT